MEEFARALAEGFAKAGIPLSAGQARRMEDYYGCLARENEKYNLTAITDPKDAAIKHFLDSALGARLLPEGAKVADVGSGAGFPAVPLRILRDDCSVTALEASEKKCRFIEEACGHAGVEIETLNMRAEEAARGEWREAFDVCVSRAVAELPVLLELCLPLVRPGGVMLAYKNAGGEEVEAAKNAAELLSACCAEQVFPPFYNGERAILVYKKTAETAEKYPRRYAQIKKRPL